jgi:predicted ATP-dependent endonuclease of OLD family
MYLKSIRINNFRKFSENNNIIEFVNSQDDLQKHKGTKKSDPKEQEKINIASSTTLIVGQNNSGKTTIAKALGKLLVSDNKFVANDFNFSYLARILEQYKNSSYDQVPVLEFEMRIGVGSNSNDLLTNIIHFVNIGDALKDELRIVLKYEIKEVEIFKENANSIIKKYKSDQNLFRKFLELIDETEFKINYYGADDKLIDKNNFKINDLITIKIINANKIINDSSLSQTFNKIVKYRYESKGTDDLDGEISRINKTVTEQVSKSHTTFINEVLHKIEYIDRLEVKLSSDLTFNKLLNNLIKYEYTEKGLHIPEGQFGLGYSNLMSIIGELIEYIEKYPNENFHSKINLICIEEPEAFMHPQMQELFIKHINEAVSFLLKHTKKKINSQLIITTHSSHILNSKIHTGNSFNNINYLSIVENFSCVVNLNDKEVIGYKKLQSESKKDYEKRKINDLKFIKKHIKYKVSELFFSDAVVFVEGITEETLLSYYIDKNDNLNKYYISIFNINGAHGLVYHSLIKLLKIPTLIITDLDIKRNEEEKENFTQIEKLEGRKTTNKTIVKFNSKDDDISKIKEHFEDGNLYIAFQNNLINGYFATSFEEAFILYNYENDILNKVLKKVKRKTYNEIVGSENRKENLKENSYKLQRELTNSKSDFSNELLYKLIICDDIKDVPNLPEYIQDGLKWLQKTIKTTMDGKIEK